MKNSNEQEPDEKMIKAWQRALSQEHGVADKGFKEHFEKHLYPGWRRKLGMPEDASLTDLILREEFGEPVYDSLDDSTLEP